VAFVRGGLLRVDSPAGLRESLGGHGVEVGLAGPLDAAVLATARGVPGVTAVEVGAAAEVGAAGRLLVTTANPAGVTPSLVRALVAAGADILEVRERVTTLEQVYFDVMGVRPDLDGAA
jgi:hypothetical protein